ncbi:MAG: response regulator transcription factor [Ruminococcus sp.]|nr:response regulator transcription factor [Ruminococcus sp.]
MSKIRVMIADDVEILRRGLEIVLAQDSGIEVVGTASDGKEAAQLAESLLPDVAIMDMRMPGFDGEYGIRRIKQSCPAVRVLVLTTFDDDETVQKAIRSGADGYILKEMDNEKILSAVKAVSGGMNVYCANVFGSVRGTAPAAEPADEKVGSLTERDRELLKLIAGGCDNKTIAGTLFLAEGTVRNNISRLLEKLGLKDRTQLAVYAVKNKIV